MHAYYLWFRIQDCTGLPLKNYKYIGLRVFFPLNILNIQLRLVFTFLGENNIYSFICAVIIIYY